MVSDREKASFYVKQRGWKIATEQGLVRVGGRGSLAEAELTEKGRRLFDKETEREIERKKRRSGGLLGLMGDFDF